jgi:hypothetical protein
MLMYIKTHFLEIHHTWYIHQWNRIHIQCRNNLIDWNTPSAKESVPCCQFCHAMVNATLCAAFWERTTSSLNIFQECWVADHINFCFIRTSNRTNGKLQPKIFLHLLDHYFTSSPPPSPSWPPTIYVLRVNGQNTYHTITKTMIKQNIWYSLFVKGSWGRKTLNMSVC